MVETPTDEVEAIPKAKPSAGNRYELFDDGEGNYRIYQLLREEQSQGAVPKGSLAPIANVGGFLSAAKAKQFIKNSGDLFTGMQLMVFRGLEICTPKIETVSRVTVNWKPKKAVMGPAVTEEAGV